MSEGLYYAGCTAVLVLFMGLATYVSHWRCEQTAEAMKLQWSWGIPQGCMVDWHGQWIPISQVRAVAP